MLASLGSLRLTLALLVVFVAGTAATGWADVPARIAVAPVLLALAANLVAAIVANPRFRKQLPLLAFHCGLLALLLLVAVGQLSGMRANAEVTVGAEFDGFSAIDAGPWHAFFATPPRFINDGFEIDYRPGPTRDVTRNRVRVIDAGGERRETVSENRPLVIGAYRFSVTGNKGYALHFLWVPRAGEPVASAIHLPAFPAHADGQWRDWSPAPGVDVYTRLDIQELVLDGARNSAWRLPQKYDVVVRRGEGRWTVRPGQPVEFPDGRLVFVRLGEWMGYEVTYDWTLPWLFAAGVFTAAALGWHFWQKWEARPWWTE